METATVMENVIDLGRNENLEIREAVKTFLDRVAQNSINTSKNYKGHINQFFRLTRNKTIEQLMVRDLQYTSQEVEAYQTGLKEKYKASTVNSKMSAIKELFNRLDRYDFDVNIKAFDVDAYRIYDSKKWDALEKEEVEVIMPEVEKTWRGYEKVLVIRIACATAFRSASILSLKKDDLIIKDGYPALKTIGKGQKHDIKKIPKSLYDDLIEFTKYSEDNRLITLNHNHVQDMMNFINKSFDFGNRSIVFHSFKKTSIDEMGIRTGYNIKAMQRHGAHSSAKTTMDNYAKSTTFQDSVLIDFDEEVNLTKLESLSKEQLVELITKTDRATQFKILQIAESL